MICCSNHYSGCQKIWKMSKCQTQALNTCWMGLFLILAHNSKEVASSFLRSYKQVEQLVDQAYMPKLLSGLSDFDICAMTTPS